MGAPPPPPHSTAELEKLVGEIAERVERWLDQGHGSCLLRDPRHAASIANAMHFFDAAATVQTSEAKTAAPRYELGGYVVMANHVHAIVKPLASQSYPLEEIVGGWKQFSAGKINRDRGRKGDLWQEETFDRIIRDEEHLWRAIRYIGSNPEKAGVPRESCRLWIRPEWESLGWTLEEP